MAKLIAARRGRLPKSDFAGPHRSYPVPDRSHSIGAKARARQQLRAGNLTRGQYDHIVEKADEALRDW